MTLPARLPDAVMASIMHRVGCIISLTAARQPANVRCEILGNSREVRGPTHPSVPHAMPAASHFTLPRQFSFSHHAPTNLLCNNIIPSRMVWCTIGFPIG